MDSHHMGPPWDKGIELCGPRPDFSKLSCTVKWAIASEYGHQIPQSHTGAVRKSHRTLTVTRHQEDR